MRFHFIVFPMFLVGCSSVPQTSSAPTDAKEKSPLVSVETTLDHIQHSYTLGCVEALRSTGKRGVYLECRERGLKHKDAVRQVLESKTDIITP